MSESLIGCSIMQIGKIHLSQEDVRKRRLRETSDLLTAYENDCENIFIKGRLSSNILIMLLCLSS